MELPQTTPTGSMPDFSSRAVERRVPIGRRHNGVRARKGFDFDAMDRLYESGYITDPRGRARSVVFTGQAQERARHLLEMLFGKNA
jgi:Domain of unknown function (DUF6429)